MESPTQQPEFCVPCGRQFIDWKDYIRHMITSGNHPHGCGTCGQEFQSEEGKQTHRRQAHPADQQLRCSGCHKEFTRCGSLVQHVEIDGCPGFRKQAFEKIRDANDDFYKNLGAKKQASATIDIFDKVHTAHANCVQSETSETLLAPPGRVQPEAGRVSAVPTSWVQYEVGKVSAVHASNGPPRDLMTDFESPNKEAEYEMFKKTFPAPRIQKQGQNPTDNVATPQRPASMNHPVEDKANDDLIEMSPNALPQLARTSRFSDLVPDDSGASEEQSNLRPPPLTDTEPDFDALSRPLIILEPLQELKLNEPQLTAQDGSSTAKQPASKYHHQYDPDQPGFDLEKYRNIYSKKYRCAFAGCTKLLNSSEGLYMHLKSNAHLTDLYSCPICFSQFHSASAITQHLESQTNRCNARDDRRFSQIIDQVAAGMINMAGRHIDNTHRFYAAQVLPKLQLDTVHEAKEEVIVNAVHDPRYRAARVREREQKLREEKARIEEWQNADWLCD